MRTTSGTNPAVKQAALRIGKRRLWISGAVASVAEDEDHPLSGGPWLDPPELRVPGKRHEAHVLFGPYGVGQADAGLRLTDATPSAETIAARF